MDNHEDLPQDYLEECEKFFDELTAKRVREAMNLKPGEVDNDHSELQQKGIKWVHLKKVLLSMDKTMII